MKISSLTRASLALSVFVFILVAIMLRKSDVASIDPVVPMAQKIPLDDAPSIANDDAWKDVESPVSLYVVYWTHNAPVARPLCELDSSLPCRSRTQRVCEHVQRGVTIQHLKDVVARAGGDDATILSACRPIVGVGG
jgi:hypothetical protein